MTNRQTLAALSRQRAMHSACMVITPRIMAKSEYQPMRDNRCDLCILADRILESGVAPAEEGDT